MINLDPVHWAAIGLGAALVLSGGTILYKNAKIDSITEELSTTRSNFQLFKDQTAAAGKISEAARVVTEAELAGAAVKIQGDLNAQYIANRDLHANYKRLQLNAAQRGAGSNEANSLADATRGVNCPNDGARLSEALGRLEGGIQIILETRDAAIIRTQACKAYIDKLVTILEEGTEHAIQHK